GIVDGDQIYNAVLRRAGVLRVYGTDEMFDGIEALTKMRPVRKETLAILSNGVGPGVLAVDRLASMGASWRRCRRKPRRRWRSCCLPTGPARTPLTSTTTPHRNFMPRHWRSLIRIRKFPTYW